MKLCLLILTLSLLGLTSATSLETMAISLTATIQRAPAGGDWKSSGETGVACFKTVEDAQEYDLVRVANVPLSDEMVDKIASLETLEHWEKKSESYPTDLSANELLSLLQQRLRRHASIVAVQLEAVASRIHLGSWEQKGILEPTQDAIPERPIEQLECRQIQLAVRVNQVTEVGQMPEIHVYYDPRLYNKLNSLNQTLLRLHERVSVLCRQVGHHDSFRVCLVVRRWFDENLWAREKENPAGLAMSLQNLLDHHLGNYIDIFNVTLQKKTIQPFTPSSRFNSLYKVVHFFSEQMEKCMGPLGDSKEWTEEKAPQIQKIRIACMNAAFADDIISRLPDEQQFAYVYRWMLTQKASKFLPNSELSVIEWKDPEMKQLADQGMREACHLIQNRILPQSQVYVPAARYCSQTEFNQSPTGKNQN